MWIISYEDDLTYDSLYDCDCSLPGGGYVIACGKTKKECEEDYKNRASYSEAPYFKGKSMYFKNRYTKIMYSPPHNHQLLIYEV